MTQMSGEDHTSESIHLFHVGKMRIKLCKGKTVIAKEYYSSAMQVTSSNVMLVSFLSFFASFNGCWCVSCLSSYVE